jgi:uncharacterized membrane protein
MENMRSYSAALSVDHNIDETNFSDDEDDSDEESAPNAPSERSLPANLSHGQEYRDGLQAATSRLMQESEDSQPEPMWESSGSEDDDARTNGQWDSELLVERTQMAQQKLAQGKITAEEYLQLVAAEQRFQIAEATAAAVDVTPAHTDPMRDGPPSPVQILKDKLKQGKITEAEYQQFIKSHERFQAKSHAGNGDEEPEEPPSPVQVLKNKLRQGKITEAEYKLFMKSHERFQAKSHVGNGDADESDEEDGHKVRSVAQTASRPSVVDTRNRSPSSGQRWEALQAQQQKKPTSPTRQKVGALDDKLIRSLFEKGKGAGGSGVNSPIPKGMASPPVNTLADFHGQQAHLRAEELKRKQEALTMLNKQSGSEREWQRSRSTSAPSAVANATRFLAASKQKSEVDTDNGTDDSGSEASEADTRERQMSARSMTAVESDPSDEEADEIMNSIDNFKQGKITEAEQAERKKLHSTAREVSAATTVEEEDDEEEGATEEEGKEEGEEEGEEEEEEEEKEEDEEGDIAGRGGNEDKDATQIEEDEDITQMEEDEDVTQIEEEEEDEDEAKLEEGVENMPPLGSGMLGPPLGERVFIAAPTITSPHVRAISPFPDEINHADVDSDDYTDGKNSFGCDDWWPSDGDDISVGCKSISASRATSRAPSEISLPAHDRAISPLPVEGDGTGVGGGLVSGGGAGGLNDGWGYGGGEGGAWMGGGGEGGSGKSGGGGRIRAHSGHKNPNQSAQSSDTDEDRTANHDRTVQPANDTRKKPSPAKPAFAAPLLAPPRLGQGSLGRSSHGHSSGSSVAAAPTGNTQMRDVPGREAHRSMHAREQAQKAVEQNAVQGREQGRQLPKVIVPSANGFGFDQPKAASRRRERERQTQISHLTDDEEYEQNVWGHQPKVAPRRRERERQTQISHLTDDEEYEQNVWGGIPRQPKVTSRRRERDRQIQISYLTDDDEYEQNVWGGMLPHIEEKEAEVEDEYSSMEEKELDGEGNNNKVFRRKSPASPATSSPRAQLFLVKYEQGAITLEEYEQLIKNDEEFMRLRALSNARLRAQPKGAEIEIEIYAEEQEEDRDMQRQVARETLSKSSPTSRAPLKIPGTEVVTPVPLEEKAVRMVLQAKNKELASLQATLAKNAATFQALEEVRQRNYEAALVVKEAEQKSALMAAETKQLQTMRELGIARAETAKQQKEVQQLRMTVLAVPILRSQTSKCMNEDEKKREVLMHTLAAKMHELKYARLLDDHQKLKLKEQDHERALAAKDAEREAALAAKEEEHEAALTAMADGVLDEHKAVLAAFAEEHAKDIMAKHYELEEEAKEEMSDLETDLETDNEEDVLATRRQHLVSREANVDHEAAVAAAVAKTITDLEAAYSVALAETSKEVTKEARRRAAKDADAIRLAEAEAREASNTAASAMALCREMRDRAEEFERQLRVLSWSRALELLVTVVDRRVKRRQQRGLLGCFNKWRQLQVMEEVAYEMERNYIQSMAGLKCQGVRMLAQIESHAWRRRVHRSWYMWRLSAQALGSEGKHQQGARQLKAACQRWRQRRLLSCLNTWRQHQVAEGVMCTMEQQFCNQSVARLKCQGIRKFGDTESRVWRRRVHRSWYVWKSASANDACLLEETRKVEAKFLQHQCEEEGRRDEDRLHHGAMLLQSACMRVWTKWRIQQLGRWWRQVRAQAEAQARTRARTHTQAQARAQTTIRRCGAAHTLVVIFSNWDLRCEILTLSHGWRKLCAQTNVPRSGSSFSSSLFSPLEMKRGREQEADAMSTPPGSPIPMKSEGGEEDDEDAYESTVEEEAVVGALIDDDDAAENFLRDLERGVEEQEEQEEQQQEEEQEEGQQEEEQEEEQEEQEEEVEEVPLTEMTPVTTMIVTTPPRRDRSTARAAERAAERKRHSATVVQLAESERLLRVYEHALHTQMRATRDEYDVTFSQNR